MNPYSTELCHHGILGQRWGRKNGPPYPLDSGDHSASERKAGWRKSLSKSETRTNVKSMSDEELRQKVNRKNLENQYKYYSSKVGDSRKANDVIDVAKKGFRTAGNLANVVSKKMQYSNKSKMDNIDDNEKLTNKQKKALKAEVRRNQTIAEATSQGMHGTANELQKKKRINLDKSDPSQMSDQELRQKVNRLMLEAQYEDAYNVNKGKERAEMILDGIGAVTSVAGTAISTMILLQNIGKKMPKVGDATPVKFG